MSVGSRSRRSVIFPKQLSWHFRAIRDQQVTTDSHLDRLAHGMTHAKNLNHVLYDICVNFNQYDSVLSHHMFDYNWVF